MSYPSDVTDDEWLEIQDFFKPEHPGRPWKYARRDIYNAIRYVQRSGCQWRMLPKGFPPWSVVYITFYRLSMRGIWQKMQDHLREKVRIQCQKDAHPRVAILDTPSVKTVQKGPQRGDDAHKRVHGRKRHLAVDTLGLVLAVVVHSAGLLDSRGAPLFLTRLFHFFSYLLKILCDAGYKSGVIAWAKAMFGYVVEVVSRSEAHTIGRKKYHQAEVSPRRDTQQRKSGMESTAIQYVSDEQGNAIAVIVPMALWREIASERETAYLLRSEIMTRRLLEARQRHDGMAFEDVCEKLGI